MKSFRFAAIFWGLILTSLLAGDTPLDMAVWSRYINGTQSEHCRHIAIDSHGNLFIAGRTSSADFTTTPGVIDESLDGIWGTFVMKLSPNGDVLASTVFDEEDLTEPNDIVIDSNDDVYICGKNGSYGHRLFKVNNDLTEVLFEKTLDCNPKSMEIYNDELILIGTDGTGTLQTTSGVLYETGPGFDDLYIVKYDPNGDYIRATYFGGANIDRNNDVACDSNGNIAIIGHTSDPTYPVSTNAYSGSPVGTMQDIVITVINSDMTELIGSTFYGGSLTDRGLGVEFRSNGDVVIFGQTHSSDLPTTAAAIQGVFGGFNDMCVAVFSPDLSELKYSSFLGGDGYDTMDVDLNCEVCIRDNQVILAMGTTSTNFPVTPNAHRSTVMTQSTDSVFVVIDLDHGNLVYSTYFGGAGFHIPADWLLVGNDCVYVAGQTYSGGMPGQELNAYDQQQDGFVVKFEFPSQIAVPTVESAKLFGHCKDPLGLVQYSINSDDVTGLTFVLERQVNDGPWVEATRETAPTSEIPQLIDTLLDPYSPITSIRYRIYVIDADQNQGDPSNVVNASPAADINQDGKLSRADWKLYRANPFDMDLDGDVDNLDAKLFMSWILKTTTPTSYQISG